MAPRGTWSGWCSGPALCPDSQGVSPRVPCVTQPTPKCPNISQGMDDICCHTYWQVGYVWYVGYGCCVSWMSGMTYLIYIYDISHVNIQSHRDGVSCIWYLISVSDIYDISHVNIQLHRDGVSCIIHRLNTIVWDSLPIGFKLSLLLSTNYKPSGL